MVRFRMVLTASAAVMTLVGCRDEAPKPKLGYVASAPAYVEDLPLAPPAEALTVGAPAPVGRVASYRDEGYAWAERAYAVDRAFHESPPDYGFYYDDVEPWAWETQDQWVLYAEPLETGYRYYYYEPGEDYPYFVRDPDYGYGFDDRGHLMVLYTTGGALLSGDYLRDRAPIAGRYWTRATELRRIGHRAPRQRIDERQWRAREPVLVRSQTTWLEAAQDRRDWRSYRQRQERRELRRFEPERERRRTLVANLDRREAYLNREERAARPAWRAPLSEGPRQAARHEDGRRQDGDRREARSERQIERADRERRETAAVEDRRRVAAFRDDQRRGREDRQARQHQQRAQAERRDAEIGQNRERQARREQVAREQEQRGRQQREARDHQQRAQAERRNAEAAPRQERAAQQQAARGQDARPERHARNAGERGRDASQDGDEKGRGRKD